MRQQATETAVMSIPPRILLAEDDDALRGLLRWALERRGYGVTESHDGLDLLDQLATAFVEDGQPYYQLVIADVRMPGVTGMEILRGLQDDPTVPPFVLITAFGSHELHEKARRYGAVAMLDKPFELGELVEVVERIVPRATATA